MFSYSNVILITTRSEHAWNICHWTLSNQQPSNLNYENEENIKPRAIQNIGRNAHNFNTK